MIERKFIKQNMTEFKIKESVQENLSRAGLSDVKLMRTPLGEKIVVFASRPGLVVGRGGANIAQITQDLKKNFNLENPQVEIEEVLHPNLDPSIVAEMIANSLERFGPNRFKGIGYKSMQNVMDAGARGVEIIISGKIPSSRARSWRFYSGYLKKCGDIAITGVDGAYTLARLKTGAVGIKVSIMPPTTKLPDDIEVYADPETVVEEAEDVKEEMEAVTDAIEKVETLVEEKPEVKDEKPKKLPAKKATKKPAAKKEEAEEKPKPAKKPAAKKAPAKKAPAKKPKKEEAEEEQ